MPTSAHAASTAPTRKDGRKRVPLASGRAKATITERRLDLRLLTWEPLKARLQQHLQTCKTGEASRIARHLGTHPSQIHRWSCPVCEHDNEPNFSQGFALAIYLTHHEHTHNRTHTHTI